jgi:superfamily I DNA/RNA helicase
MKMRDVINLEKCYVKDTYRCFSEDKGKNYYNGIVISNLFQKYGLDFTKDNIIVEINDTMPNNVFETKREEVINSTHLIVRLLRMSEYFHKEVLGSTINVYNGGSLSVVGNKVEVPYNFILENTMENKVTIVKVENRKGDISKSGRSIYTKIADNMELFLLSEVGRQLYPDRDVEGMVVFLRHPDDTDRALIPVSEFNNSKTIVSTSFDSDKRMEMIARVEDAINGTSKIPCPDCNTTCPYALLCQYQRDETDLTVIPAKAKASGDVKFTKTQQEVINADSGVFRVLAGAGSGKTTCVANRICNLVKKGFKFEDMLLITFTTKGAEEMKEKVEYWATVNNITTDFKKLEVYTFNSFGYKLLKREYKNFGFTEEPVLIEKFEKLSIIKALLDSKPEIDGFNYKDPTLNLPNAKGVLLLMDAYFTIIKDKELTLVEEVQEHCNIGIEEVAQQVLDLYNEYQDYMFTHNLVDYVDQIRYCNLILQDEEKLKKYGYEIIIVDEFQDSDTYQIDILKKLHSAPQCLSLMVVGDDSQAIYSWRGATSDNIIHFKDVFPETKDIPLVENFRSTEEICTLANKINNLNLAKVPKELASVKSGTSPKLYEVKDVKGFVEKMIEVALYYGYDFSDMALIARNKSDLLEIQKVLISKGIPSIISVSELLIDNPVIKHLINFARYILEPSSSLYFAEYLQIADYDEYMSQSKNTLPIYVDLKKTEFEAGMEALEDEEAKLEYLMGLFEGLAAKERSVASLVEVLKSKPLHTVKDLCQFMIDMETYQADYSIEKFEDTVDAVTLTTGHSSKGREWEFVGIYLDTLSYPNVLEYPSSKNLPIYEEERRLLFVSLTRAKETLVFGGDSSKAAYIEVSEALKEK